MNRANLDPLFVRIAEMDRSAGHSGIDRKVAGITYTPPAIAREMVSMLDPQPEWTIREPSCGRGVFAFALAEHWLRRGLSMDDVAAWGERNLLMGDLDADAVADLRTLWADTFGRAPARLECEDGLLGDAGSIRTDAVIGNPPYVRVQNLEPDVRSAIRSAFPSCAKGNVDIYYAFIESALRRAAHVCYITPDSWLTARAGEALRTMAHGRIRQLTCFGSHLVFAPVRAYTAIALFGSDDAHGEPICARTGDADGRGDWVCSPRIDARFDDRSGWTPFHAAQDHGERTLGDMAEVLTGVATLADGAYILNETTTLNGGAEVVADDTEFPGHSLRVPVALAPQLLKITRPGRGVRILCPYDGEWTPIPETRLREDALGLLDWLERRRDRLDRRDKGNTKAYPAWYAYGRRQGFWTPRKGEVVIAVPQMGNGRLKASVMTMDGSRLLFTSGFLIRPHNPDDTDTIVRALTSEPAWEFVKRFGKGWAGKGDYRTIGAPALRRLPIPER